MNDKTVLIIGSGPIVIGQACEFDYSGTQACKALKQCGYRVVLVNSNPATIMTDPQMADATYIEPLNVETLEKIIAKERPDYILSNLGGQTGLNLSTELSKQGILEKYNVKVIGVDLNAIEHGEDREVFKSSMAQIGIETPKSGIVHSVEEACELADKTLGYPVVVRPAYTMGGAGGGFCNNKEELVEICAKGLDASLTHQCLIEESIYGWEELEVEVVRDSKNQMVVVCFIENIDPVGIHTGDSFCAAPFLTISKALEEKLKADAFKIVESIGVIGGTNVQFAHDPKTDRTVIIEINPRTSRSSALASKATGFPIALVSAKLAAGMTLDQLPYGDSTLDKYVPSGDYVVLKFARWAFEKFPEAKDVLGTSMKAVGEVMSIGKNFKEAFQKSIRALENGHAGLGFDPNFHYLGKDTLLEMIKTPSSTRYFQIYEALRKNATVEEICKATCIKQYFIKQMAELVDEEEMLCSFSTEYVPDDLLIQAKRDGFSDKYIAKITCHTEDEIRQQREKLGCLEKWDAVPVSGVKDKEYYYSSYCIDAENSHPVSTNPKKVMILGGGPNRIGQGIEFDYCCCHASMILKEMGYETIIVNCNPETVSTDYDTSDKLYFEPVTVEDVLQIYRKENPIGVIVQFGGQTPLNIARQLHDAGCNILGTSVDSIEAAENRQEFYASMMSLGIPMPYSCQAYSLDETLKAANKIGYPVIIRPSFVLGGRGMSVVYDDDQLKAFLKNTVISEEKPLYIDRFLHNALECEADALSDGDEIYIPAIMQHIELAGVHSGDSACVLPSVSLTYQQKQIITDYASKIAKHLDVVGLMNIQFAVEDGKVYVLEANPRASRTVPFVSKVMGLSMAKAATQLMLGKKFDDIGLAKESKVLSYFGVKEAIMPFDRFSEVDPVLGPEMKSTGEVLGFGATFEEAYAKSQAAAKMTLPKCPCNVLISTYDKTDSVKSLAEMFSKADCQIYATHDTGAFLEENGIKVIYLPDGRWAKDEICQLVKDKKLDLIVNIPSLQKKSIEDHGDIRKLAVQFRIPYATTIDAALALAKSICSDVSTSELLSLQERQQEASIYKKER